MPDDDAPDIDEETRQRFYEHYIGPQDDPCPGCGAVWVYTGDGGVRTHKDDCVYLAWEDDCDKRGLSK